MKNLFFLLGFFLTIWGSYAQPDSQNQKKYWKFRNNFRKDFIRIGSERGESIPAAARKPISCKNNSDDVPGTQSKGTMRWADGMIFQGHYIGFLATEYKLLAKNGGDTRATLNELYYALKAINRVDLNAEPIVTTVPDTQLPLERDAKLDGFYIRDDIPEGFHENWENEKMDCRCVEGDSYISNNTARLNSDGDISKYRVHKLSGPSLDQMTSLLVGLSVCHYLLEDGMYVQPTPEDDPVNLKNEVVQIAHRLISYAYEHNWFLLDEWGWPVANGGGDCMFTAYPLSIIGKGFTGYDYDLHPIVRQKFTWDYAQKYHCQSPENRAGHYDTIGVGKKAKVDKYFDWNPWPYESTGYMGLELSNFEALQLYMAPGGATLSEISTEVDFLDFLWEDLYPEKFVDYAEDWYPDSTFDEMHPWPFGTDKHPWNIFSDYNFTISFNLGVISGLFDSDHVAEWGVHTGNYQLVLIHALLNNTDPAFGSQFFYEELLSSMPVYGGFKFSGQEWYGDPDGDGVDSVGYKQTVWAPSWGGEYKWNDPVESNSGEGHEGQFNSLDYLYLHNLYNLVYDEVLSEEVEETYECFCGSVDMGDIYPLQSDSNDDIVEDELTLDQVLSGEVTLHSNMVKQLSVLDFCTENVFGVSSSTTSTINIKQLFDHYHDIGISLNEYQTEEFTVSDGGQVNIESRLVICNTKKLNVLEGGEINLDKGEILIKPGAQLVIEGEVNISPYTKVIVESEGEIIIKGGGELNNSGYIQLKEGAKMTYEDGAIFRMRDDRAELHFDGGDLFLKLNANFTFEKGASQSGQIRMSRWGEHIFTEGNNSIILTGNGDHDPILVIDKDSDFWVESTGLDWTTMTSGQIIFNDNARLVSISKYTANNIRFEGGYENRGLTTFSKTTISNSKFNEVPIFSPLYFQNSGTFTMTLSEVNSDSINEMVKIKGMGYNISQTDFNGGEDVLYMLSSQNITEYSLVTNCTFSGPTLTTAVFDNSKSTLDVQKSDFNNLRSGIHKIDGKLISKCNNFSNFRIAGILAYNNCVVDVSSDAQGGYNIFEKSSGLLGKNIGLVNAGGILLNNGYNFFDDQGSLPIIDGTINVMTSPLYITSVLARKNKWNPENTTPLSSEFNITSSITGASIGLLANSPSIEDCPIDDGGLVSGGVTLIPNYTDNEATLNTTSFTDVSFSSALKTSIEATNAYDVTNSDLDALALFEEMLVTYPSMEATLKNQSLAATSSQFMKQTLQHALYTGEITRDSDEFIYYDGTLSPVVDKTEEFYEAINLYVNALNALTSVDFNENNYQQLFQWEMDKVHLFHLLGNYDLAMSILINTEACGLDSAEQAYVNHWKNELATESKKIQYGYNSVFMDSVWVDTSSFIQPSHKDFGGFGSKILDLNTIEFYDCQKRGNKKGESAPKTGLSVYPNPNNGIFQIEYNLPDNSTGYIIIHSVDGKQLHRFECLTGKQIKNVNITGVESGTHLYSYYINGVVTMTGKIVVE